MSASIIPAVSLGLVAALLSWLAHASERGQLGRNGAVGIRTSATMRSDAAWDAGHRAAASLTRWSAWSSWLGCIGAITLASMNHPWVWLPLVAGYLAMFTLLMAATTRANRAAREAIG